MNKVIICAAVFAVFSARAQARPLLLEKAGNINPAGVFELGFERVSYQYDFTEFTGADAELTRNIIYSPFVFRYSVSDTLEAKVTAPFVYQKTVLERPAIGTTVTDEVSGLGNTNITVKYSPPVSGVEIGLLAEAGFNTGGDDFPVGTDISPSLLIRRDFGAIILNASFGYSLTGKYEAADEEIDPGNVLRAGLGLERRVGENIAVNGEFLYDSIGEASVDGAGQAGSSGSRSTAVLGGYYFSGSLTYSLGIAVSLGDEAYRDYDYSVLAGMTLRL